MNPNDSFLSTVSNANTGAPVMARIVANVVDMQQQLINQYQTIVSTMDGLKTEVHTGIQSLREDLRRNEDRTQKQVDDIRGTHANEVDRLMDLIKILLVRETGSSSQTYSKIPEQPRMNPAQLAYANAASASNFFAPPAATPNDLTAHAQYMAYYMQQLQEQQRMRSMAPASGFFGNQAGVGMSGMGLPGAIPQSQQPSTMLPVATGLPTVPKPPTVAPPVAAVPPVTATVSVPLSVPAPAVVSSAAPISTTCPTSTATTTTSSLAGLFQSGKAGTATATVQPGKVEAPKTETITPKPAFSFITAKPSTPVTPPMSSDTSKSSASIFSGIKPTENVFSKTPETKASVKKEPSDGHDEEEHDHVDEFEPQVDFKPVCPLPELVKVVTGEEDEKVLFEERCKLYRFADDVKEWKERGTGTMKILENKSTNKCRIVMRREQVHKVCANHQLLPGMTIQAMPRQEKAMIWYCEDFSEEQKSHEKLSARFASVEIANKFKEVFESAVKKAGHGTPVKPITAAEAKKEEEKTKKTDDEIKDKKNEVKVVDGKGDEKKDAAKVTPVTQKGYGDQFKLQPGQWECQECYSRTDAEKCPCCGTAKGGDKTAASATKSVLPASTIPLGGTNGGATQQKFTFGLSAAAAAKDTQTPTSASATPKSSLFGASLTTTSGSTPTTGFSFGSKSSIFGGAVTKTTEGSTLPTFSFAKKSDAASAATSTATSASTTTSAASPVTFSFKQTGSTTSSPSTGSSLFGGSKLFGASKPAEEKKDSDKMTEQSKTEQKVFGSGFGSNLSFASLAKSSSGSIFDSANTQKAQAEFAAQAKSKLAIADQKEKEKGESTKTKGENEDGEPDHGADEEYEPDVHFAPVIPLPDLVDVVTGEEEEQVVFTARAKLFRFIKETKENKERGVGEIKILRNPKNNAHRVVMRREQVHKVCANFAILPSIELNEKKGMPNVYNWICRDYSESAEGSDEIFTAKFKTAEIAKEFHDKFVAAAAAHPSGSK